MSSRNVPPPYLISWNITKRCNLKCAHCYLDTSEFDGAGDIPAAQAIRFVNEIAALNPHAILILTGGEPMLRPDFYDIASYAASLGISVVVGTNGTLIDNAAARRMRGCGIKGAGISLDSTRHEYHDGFRGVPGAWSAALGSMDALREAGLPFQVQLTVTRWNKDEIPAVIELARLRGAKAVNVFFLVCTGRGQQLADIGPAEYEQTLRYLVKAEEEYRDSIIVRARCAPHFLRVAEADNGYSPLLKGATAGCIAGKHYLRISPEGLVTPCPYMPVTEGSPSLLDASLEDIWENGAEFTKLRASDYGGRCGRCEFKQTCGGCRARALAASGDIMAQDPWCEYNPAEKPLLSPDDKRANAAADPVWSDEAKRRLDRVPGFLKGMVKAGVERYAKARGFDLITPELMIEMRRKTL